MAQAETLLRDLLPREVRAGGGSASAPGHRGVSVETMNRAKRRLAAQSDRTRHAPRWAWYLPATPDPDLTDAYPTGANATDAAPAREDRSARAAARQRRRHNRQQQGVKRA